MAGFAAALGEAVSSAPEFPPTPCRSRPRGRLPERCGVVEDGINQHLHVFLQGVGMPYSDYSDQLVLPRLIILSYELLLGRLYQSLDIPPADTDASKLIHDDGVNVLDVHETMHSSNPEGVA
jgi:hypothetical protein